MVGLRLFNRGYAGRTTRGGNQDRIGIMTWPVLHRPQDGSWGRHDYWLIGLTVVRENEEGTSCSFQACLFSPRGGGLTHP